MIKIFLIILLILIAILQVHNVSVYPVTKGFDAGNHKDYITFLQDQKRVPLPYEGWELYQPPLYYLIASFFPNLFLAKTIGLAFWIILVSISYLFFKNLTNDVTLSLLGTLVVSSLPVVLYLTPAIGNEFFSAVMISIVLVYYLQKRKKSNLKAKTIFGVFIGLALISKATAWIAVASIVLNELWLNRKQIQKTVRGLIIPFGIGLLISGWFYLRNLVLFKNPFVTSVDFPQFKISQTPGYRDIKFFTDLSGFLKLDLFRAHHYSLWSGTYFSWFYDGHNVMLPIQSFSKIGIALVIFSIPLFIFAVLGFFKELKMISKKNSLFVIYSVLLFLSYVLYNLKLPFYSTVKGSFLVSLVIPFGFFFVKGIEPYKKNLNLIVIYLLFYVIIVVRNFWILPQWYTPLLSNCKSIIPNGALILWPLFIIRLS